MRTVLVSGFLLALAGCATVQPAPTPEWRLVDGSWVGPATTYQDGSAPGHATCNDPRYTFACQSDGIRRAIEDAARSIR